MARRKQPFRFRFPWLSGAHESSSRCPKDASKSPPQSDTNVPIQRPSVITPAESPPSPLKTQESPRRTEPQNQSQPHPTQPTAPSSSSVLVETSPNLVNTPPPSLQQPSSSHAASQVHIVSTQPQPPSNHDTMKVPRAEESTHPSSSSASEQEKEKMINKSEPMPRETEPELKLNSPLRTTTKSPETSFQPERMSTQPAGSKQQASSMPSSSPLAPEQTNEVLNANNHEETTLNASSSSQEEKEKMAAAVSDKVPQEAEPKMKSPLKIIPKSPKNLSTQYTAKALDEERSISKTPKSPLETPSKFLRHEEKEKVVHQSTKVSKAKDTSTSQATRHTKASASGTKDKKQHGIRETVERKIMFATSNSSGKDIGVVNSTDPRTRNVSSSSISPQRTVTSSEEKEKGPLQKGIKDDITNFVHKIAASVNPTHSMEDKKFSVITLAGDNRGATMHVGSESGKKEGSIHIHRAYKTDPDEESAEVTTDGEGNTNTEEDSMEDGEVGMACVNSNIQSINNSLMFQGSISERDPGVQVTLPQKPLEAIKPNDKDNHKTELNISRAQKSTFQPTVRRRYLRGLLHERSDPDPDNTDKPRRHGCKFSCGKNNEDIEIM